MAEENTNTQHMIALITATGARPKQIGLCAKFMKHQSYQGEVLWVIVDDVIPVTTDFITEDFRQDWKIIKVYPKPAWSSGQNTQCRNLLEGISVVKQHTVSTISIIEDDDYYSPYYLSEMKSRLEGYDIAGEQHTIYYNPINRAYKDNNNIYHSSLFQTVFSPAIIPKFEEACSSKKRFVDVSLYRSLGIDPGKINLFNGRYLAIGMKGLPGRPGIGLGHRRGVVTNADPKMTKLREWIGDDYIYYLNMK